MEKLASLSLYVTLAFMFLTYKGVVHGAATISLCSQTPYPELCNSLHIPEEESMHSFRNKALSVTLAQAEKAHKNMLAMNVSSFNELGKSAWATCLKLYEDTLYQLTRSNNSAGKSKTTDDVQTWLSAAMANHQTCLDGFHDLQLSSYLEKFPSFVLDDFSKQLCNSLAINKATALLPSLSTSPKLKSRRLLVDGAAWPEGGSTKSHMPENYTAHIEIFPEWLSVFDRKLLQQGTTIKADIVVAQDGSGNYKTISEALAASKSIRKGTERFVIYVKRGIYAEYVEIEKTMNNFMFIGDGIDATVVTGKKSNHTGYRTFDSATFAVDGDGFIAKGMTFENTAGPQEGQAVALRSDSDFSVFYRCSFKGYQDTLYVHKQRQFYRDCDIYGTVDFIFGDATVVFQNCNIYLRKPMGNEITITAQGKECPHEPTGIIINNSRVTAASDLSNGQGSSIKSYLGRPWKKYSTTVFIKTFIDGLIDPAGWLPMNGTFALDTLYYGEYNNTGAGAATGGRVNWPGYHNITNLKEAEKFSVANFLSGDSWLPATGVPYTPGI